MYGLQDPERAVTAGWIVSSGFELGRQVLAGGFAGRFRRDYEWPTSIDTEAENAACGGYVDGVLVLPCEHVPYPAFDEERSAGLVVQPGMGVDVNVWRR